MPPRKRKSLASLTPRRPPPNLEYRAKWDGAWYGARPVVQGGLLRVMYENYREETDEWYDPAADFASPQDVAALRARFRAASPPLDDACCRELRPGQRLCVICAVSDAERKYFDAVLDSVKRVAHGSMDGEERCACRFKVRWMEGPHAGGCEEVGIEDVCCLEDSPVQDPVLSEFLERVTKSFANGNWDATTAPHGP